MLKKQSAEIIDELLESATPEELDYILRKTSAVIPSIAKGRDILLKGRDAFLKGRDILLKGGDAFLKGGKNYVRRYTNPLKGADNIRTGLSRIQGGESYGLRQLLGGAKQMAIPAAAATAAGAGALYGLGRLSGRAAQQREFDSMSRLERLKRAW